MSILSDIWEGVRTTLVGLKVTVPYIWKKPVTTMYPHQRLELPERVRNRLYVNMDDCIGCDQCARACPVNCISIETAKAVEGDSPGLTSNGKKKALWVTRFDIDIAKCCYCGLCTYPCPTECIKMTDVFEFSEQERNNLIYSYITLTPEEIGEKINLADMHEAALAARKAAAKAAAAPPAAEASPAPPASVVPAAVSRPAQPSLDPDSDKAAKLAELQAKMAAAKAKREAETSGATAVPASSPAPAAQSSDADADKAAKLAEIQAKMAAAKVKREAESSGTPASSSTSASQSLPDADVDKAAKLAEIQAKMAAAKAKREAESSGTTASSAPEPSVAPPAASPAPPASPGDDPEKAARIAAMKEKIEALKRERGEG